jgi:putative chitinase
MAFINTLYNLWPQGDKLIPGLRDGIANAAPVVFLKYGIEPNLVVAHLMAQISLECNAGLEVVENLNYTARRMCQVWPSRFRTIESAQPYAGNPRALGNKVYNGRMGNRPGTDDGYNHRGRGATQTTGAGRYIPAKGKVPAIYEGYAGLQGFLAEHGVSIDLVNDPDLINNPAHFLECGVADFIICGCLPYAKADNVLMVTEKLNGGTTGFADRVTWLRRWKPALGV